jgi:hypothetical protein
MGWDGVVVACGFHRLGCCVIWGLSGTKMGFVISGEMLLSSGEVVGYVDR